MKFDVLILCGGKNSRIQKYKKDIIKPLIKFKKKTLLDNHLNNLKSITVNNIFINVPHNKRNFFDKINKKINIIYEKIPTGTAGVVLNNLKLFHKNLIVIYGDNFLKINFKQTINSFRKDDLYFFVSVFKKKDLSKSGRIIKNRSDLITKIEEKKLKNKYVYGFCNAGVYIFRKSLLKNVKNEKKIVDFSKDIIPNLIKNKKVKAILNVTKCLGFDDAQLYRKNLS